MRASDNFARVGCNVNPSDRLVVPRQLILQLVTTARLLEQVDIVLASDGERLAVGGEGMVRNGVVEEVVNFGASHADVRVAIGDSLLLQLGW